ncbi:MAG: hypothetical protein KGO02_20945 [Alphaproteobacteria bacterium]|nr:hypothetical protein [Alphaproteobacteria bacterium]
MALKTAVRSAEMDASDALAEKLTEDSAPRGAVEQETIVAAYDQIRDNLMLMGQHHCSPLDRPIDAHIYLGDALTCQGDLLKAQVQSSTTSPASCDRSTWKPFAATVPGVSHGN